MRGLLGRSAAGSGSTRRALSQQPRDAQGRAGAVQAADLCEGREGQIPGTEQADPPSTFEAWWSRSRQEWNCWQRRRIDARRSHFGQLIQQGFASGHDGGLCALSRGFTLEQGELHLSLALLAASPEAGSALAIAKSRCLLSLLELEDVGMSQYMRHL